MSRWITAGIGIVLLGGGLSGCAHHQQNQYSYAPPLAPPVYPQPQQLAPPSVSIPPPGVAPVMVPGMPPSAAIPAAAVPAGVMPTAAVVPCDPCQTGSEYVVGAGGVVMADGQSPPCPPGP